MAVVKSAVQCGSVLRNQPPLLPRGLAVARKETAVAYRAAERRHAIPTSILGADKQRH